jgi:hypothetical protein
MTIAKKINRNIDLMKAERFRGVLPLDEDDAGILILCLNYQGDKNVWLYKNNDQYRESFDHCSRIMSEIEKSLEACNESGGSGLEISLSFWEMGYLMSVIEYTRDMAKEDNWDLGIRIELEVIHENLREIYNRWNCMVSRKKTSVKN